jgi:2-keto-4-pentenoate hydratase/2-oxohepta-3-ene-1,7-dioic acid hydratase in catechol pathway
MRWVRVRHDGAEHTGRVVGEEVLLTSARSPLEAVMSGAKDTGVVIPLDERSLLAPLVPIRNVMCVGWNYLPHFEEGTSVHGERPLPERPNIFTKATTTVVGPFDDIPLHADVTSKLDWEVELAVVIGRQCVDLDESSALEVVAGYMVSQDIGARDVQHAHGGQWFRGKSLDGTCPIGPWLVDTEEIPDPQVLDISCTIDGNLKQSSNTSTMIFPVARILAELSRGITLLPGDIVLTGTPEGVGQSRTPPEFLASGSTIESTISGIGTIRNTVR